MFLCNESVIDFSPFFIRSIFCQRDGWLYKNFVNRILFLFVHACDCRRQKLMLASFFSRELYLWSERLILTDFLNIITNLLSSFEILIWQAIFDFLTLAWLFYEFYVFALCSVKMSFLFAQHWHSSYNKKIIEAS